MQDSEELGVEGTVCTVMRCEISGAGLSLSVYRLGYRQDARGTSSEFRQTQKNCLSSKAYRIGLVLYLRFLTVKDNGSWRILTQGKTVGA